ncbi:hypothetical protein GGR51DRAFT_510532 [Nemania sp. FL0031]|nr:hypothetical protein GGR51DRAFT_510532 [Nemania sp. FL0031]
MSISQLPPDQQEFILNRPSIDPPPGITSNFEHPPNKNGLVLGVIVLCLSLATVALVLRAYTKLVKLKCIRVEDALGLVAFLSFAGYIGTTLWRLNFRGTFIHGWDIQLRDLSPILLVGHILNNFYPVTLLTIKMAILIEWQRIFVPPGTRGSFYWACCVLIVFNTLFYTSTFIAANLACIPYRAIWDITISGRCINSKGLITSGAIINFVLDQSGVVSAIARLAASVEYVRTRDAIYKASEVSLWAIAEMTCAFLVFCVPSIPRAFAGKGVLTRIAASMRSWGLMSRSLLGTEASERYESQRGPSVSSASDSYRKIDDHGVEMKRMPPARSMRVQGGPPVSGRKIEGLVFTKQFTAEEEYINSDDSAAQTTFKKHHPWEQESAA